MDYEAVNVSISEQLKYETNKKTTVIIIDNKKGLFDLIEEKIKSLKSDKRTNKIFKGAAGFGGGLVALGFVMGPAGVLGEMIFFAIMAILSATGAAAFYPKHLKKYRMLNIDEEKKEIVLVRKEYDEKNDTYHRKGETVIASENEVEEQNNPAEEKGE